MTDHSTTPIYQKLQRASQLLETAVVLASETSDADLRLCRAINQAVVVLTETSFMLVSELMLELRQPV
ncbi:hypothetical protein [Pseudomonas massiliensis]|uniref:hypothetical protein n=1 Tax=Pseudomonas massiliensis TaxID=522492 RepID=UPI0005904870|nr:hypothetical protein [Pseudomonas massiliensis]